MGIREQTREGTAIVKKDKEAFSVKRTSELRQREGMKEGKEGGRRKRGKKETRTD